MFGEIVGYENELDWMRAMIKAAWPDPRKDAVQRWRLHCSQCSGVKDSSGKDRVCDWRAADYKNGDELLAAAYKHCSEVHASVRTLTVMFDEVPIKTDFRRSEKRKMR